MRYFFRRYKIQTWTEREGETSAKESLVKHETTRWLVTNLTPNSRNLARVLAYNSRYNGPASEVIVIETPEGVPGTVATLEAIPMGSSALLLTWKKPEQTNGVLTGYRVSRTFLNCFLVPIRNAG